MKKVYYLLIMVNLVFFTNCNSDDDLNPTKTLNGIWNVKNISGGIAGINVDYDTGIMTWEFNNQVLTIKNNASQGDIYYSGYKSGTYNYSTNEVNGINYIIINNIEYGGYTLSVNNLTIDQNRKSSGSGADGFMLQFKR